MSRPRYIPLPAEVAALCATLCAPAAAAQQILEVDLSAGRTIIDDEWRSMGSIILAVDHDRGILYVNDAEEPEGIMAFSLSTGERIRVLHLVAPASGWTLSYVVSVSVPIFD